MKPSRPDQDDRAPRATRARPRGRPKSELSLIGTLSAEVDADGEAMHQTVYAALRRAQMAGRFAPAQGLVIRTLASEFGTSPMPVREALRRLVAENALEQADNRTIRVPAISLGRLADLRRCRTMIEGAAAEWAVAATGRTHLEELTAINEAVREASREGDVESLLEHNQRFHFRLYGLAGSPVLMSAIESLWLQAGPYLNYLRPTLLRGGMLDHHTGILEAMAAEDPGSAAAALRADIEEAADFTASVLS
ncbi:MAG: GntR family transcriptional regulator, partial [Rhodobacteraceae bacterium]|nr:GntR family transcriptional regulator [Paracoccaceae bacterium]